MAQLQVLIEYTDLREEYFKQEDITHKVIGDAPHKQIALGDLTLEELFQLGRDFGVWKREQGIY